MMPHQKKIQQLILSEVLPRITSLCTRTGIPSKLFPLNATISSNTEVVVVFWQFLFRAAALHCKMKICYVISTIMWNDLDRALLLSV